MSGREPPIPTSVSPVNAPDPHPPPTGEDPSSPPPSPDRVAALKIFGPRGERALVTLEDETEIRLGAETVLSIGLRTGDPVDEQLRATLVDAGIRWEAREAGLRFLAHRARSRRELETRLRKRGFPAAIVRELADEFTERGYLDDGAFARSFVSDRLRLRPRGRRALEAELRARGIADTTARAALDQAFGEEGATEEAIAHTLAEGWLRRQPAAARKQLLSRDRTPERERVLRRYRSFMARRGIPGGLALDALDALRRSG